MKQIMNITPEIAKLHEDVRKDNFEPLWVAGGQVMLPEPKSKPIPYIWKWDTIRKHLERAAEVIDFQNGGDRRVLMLINPGMRDLEPFGWGATTQTMSACVQILLPGEKAPAHRHTQNAMRFISMGTGTYSAVEYQKVYMSEGDYVITPKGLWHEHEHEGTEPMIWMDCLDTPLVYYLHATFFERYPDEWQPITVKPQVDKYRGATMVRPLSDHTPNIAALPVYQWKPTVDALKGLSDHYDPDPVEGYVVEYFNPSTGKSAVPNIGAWMQKLPPKFHGKAHRHVSSVVIHVKEGRGYTVIDGVRFDWSKGDFLVIPSWCWHEHVNLSDSEDAYLFQTNDIPLYELLDLQRTEDYAENGGHQQVLRNFSE